MAEWTSADRQLPRKDQVCRVRHPSFGEFEASMFAEFSNDHWWQVTDVLESDVVLNELIGTSTSFWKRAGQND